MHSPSGLNFLRLDQFEPKTSNAQSTIYTIMNSVNQHTGEVQETQPGMFSIGDICR